MQKKPKIFYGWWIVGGGFATTFLSLGITVYARSIFFRAMFNDLGWGRGELALAMSIGSLAAAFLIPFVGSWVDRHGASKLMALGAFLSGISLIASSQIRLLWHAYAIFIFSTVAYLGIRPLPIQVTISHWFTKRRGRAIGIAAAGLGMGGFLLSPFTAYLISVFGWRTSWVVMGVITMVVIIPIALWIMKPKPAVMGLFPDGEEAIKEDTATKTELVEPVQEVRKKSTREIFKESTFWMMVGIWTLYFVPVNAISIHSFAMFTDKGVADLTAGAMVGIMGLFSTIGKVALGYLCERIPVRYVVTSAISLFAFSIFLLNIGAVWVLWPFVILTGLSFGATAIQALQVVRLFDVADMGKVLGLLNLFSALATIFAAPVTGYIFDYTGGYGIALVSFVIILIPAAALSLLARPRVGTALS